METPEPVETIRDSIESKVPLLHIAFRSVYPIGNDLIRTLVTSKTVGVTSYRQHFLIADKISSEDQSSCCKRIRAEKHGL
jgi:hypothetical protein